MHDPLTPTAPPTRQIFRSFPFFLYLNTFTLSTFTPTIFLANTYYLTDLNWAWWKILLPLTLYSLGIIGTAFLTDYLKTKFSTSVHITISLLINVSFPKKNWKN
jgi:hypothetical protein